MSTLNIAHQSDQTKKSSKWAGRDPRRDTKKQDRNTEGRSRNPGNKQNDIRGDIGATRDGGSDFTGG